MIIAKSEKSVFKYTFKKLVRYIGTSIKKKLFYQLLLSLNIYIFDNQHYKAIFCGLYCNAEQGILNNNVCQLLKLKILPNLRK